MAVQRRKLYLLYLHCFATVQMLFLPALCFAFSCFSFLSQTPREAVHHSSKMLPFSTDDYHRLLQKIAVLETKIHRLEVNVKVNEQCGNDTTIPWIQNSGQDHANTRLITVGKTSKKQEGCVSTNGSPPWNSLGAKPKSKSFPWDMGGCMTGRAQRPQICDVTGWPALSSRAPLQPLFLVGHSCGQLWKGELTTNLPNNQLCNCTTDLHHCRRTLDLRQMTWIISHLHTVG